MGPEWEDNEDVFRAVLADEITPLERCLQTLRVWLEVVETEYALGDRQAMGEALEVIRRTCRELSALLPVEGPQAAIVARYLAQAQTALSKYSSDPA